MKNQQHTVIIEYVDELPRDEWQIKNQCIYVDKKNNKWIYNSNTQQYELIGSEKLNEYTHVPSKLDKKDNSHKYIEVDNVNRTTADGLNPEVTDNKQQHHIINTKLLDDTIDDLVKEKHVPSKLDLKPTSKYLVSSNENRTAEDGLKEGSVDNDAQHHLIDPTELDKAIDDLKKNPIHVPGRIDLKNNSKYITTDNVNREDLEVVDENQQHFLIDTTRLEEKLDELPDTKYQHVPSKLDIINDKNKLLAAINENRTTEDGLEAGLTDNKQQHHVIDAKGLNDLIDLITPYNHVPAILTKFDNEYDYLTVDNKNRAPEDGLDPNLTDYLFQKHILNTSKLDLIINSLEINTGTEIVIAGASKPDDDTSIDIGDTTRFNDIKIYYRADSFSVSQNVNILPVEKEAKGSFILTNIGDAPVNKETPLTGEIGQTLCQLNDDLTKTSIRFYNTAIMRFQVQNGDGVNGSFNRVRDSGLNDMQKNGMIAFGTVVLPYPSIGNGWLEIIKITGVIYGTQQHLQKLYALIDRLEKNQYVDYQDFNLYVKYVISSQNERQLELLDHLERFETELRNEPITAKEADNKTRYDYLIEYREELRKALEKK